MSPCKDDPTTTGAPSSTDECHTRLAWAAEILGIFNFDFVIRRNRLIKLKQLDIRVMTNRWRIRILDHDRLTNPRQQNVWFERAEVIIQHDGLLELCLVVGMDFDLLAQLRPQENDRIHQRVVFTNNQRIVSRFVIDAVLIFVHQTGRRASAACRRSRTGPSSDPHSAAGTVALIANRASSPTVTRVVVYRIGCLIERL